MQLCDRLHKVQTMFATICPITVRSIEQIWYLMPKEYLKCIFHCIVVHIKKAWRVLLIFYALISFFFKSRTLPRVLMTKNGITQHLAEHELLVPMLSLLSLCIFVNLYFCYILIPFSIVFLVMLLLRSICFVPLFTRFFF